jgi:hypothetical protein
MQEGSVSIDLKPFHVVCHRREIEGRLVTQTYSIYVNNECYLKPPRGKKLSRREAYWICAFLNGDTTSKYAPRSIPKAA